MLIDDICVCALSLFRREPCLRFILFDTDDVSMRFQTQDQHNKVIKHNFKSCHTCHQMVHVTEKVQKILLTMQPGYCLVI